MSLFERAPCSSMFNALRWLDSVSVTMRVGSSIYIGVALLGVRVRELRSDFVFSHVYVYSYFGVPVFM